MDPDPTPDSLPREDAARTTGDGRKTAGYTKLLAIARAELVRRARRHGYLDHLRWHRLVADLAAHGVSAAEQAQFRDELARMAAAEGWIFPDEATPSDTGRRLEALVAKARRQARRVPVITQGYLSALLALGCVWGLAHEDIAQELAQRSVAERWPVDWELACEMEGLLGAEQARQRLNGAWEQALAKFEWRGQKGWLSEADRDELFVGLRMYGASDAEARGLLARLRAEADARRWAWSGAWTTPRLTETSLELLVDKVAQQAERHGRVGADFRQALLDEATAAKIDPAMLLDAIAERRRGEHWAASFDCGWQLPPLGPLPWWRRVVNNGRGWTVSKLRSGSLARGWRPLGPSGLRMAPPLVVVVLAGLFVGQPLAPPRAVASVPAAVRVATIVTMPVVPVATVVATPAPVDTFVVAHTDGLGARLRTAPATGPVARLLGEGTAVVVIGPEMQVDGTAWRQVRAPDGTPGWMAADLLQPSLGEPSAAG